MGGTLLAQHLLAEGLLDHRQEKVQRRTRNQWQPVDFYITNQAVCRLSASNAPLPMPII
ncbi:hypothetical protein HOV93_04900 [Planctomycetes bacterium FF15]|uniref:Uncharacterized protein n=1 Tax=Bremerella alba TaxID=980252 RepID=A0A7V8V1U9_9BACT|nr:hypothetical protein [Bremerella alba]